MKNLILILTIIISLTTTHELYAQGNSGKEKPQREKNEREKPEKDRHEKNIKAEDAQQNWGKLKDEYEDLDKYEQKQIKEEITAKKRVRNEIRRELEKNPDFDLSLTPEYDPNNPKDLEKLVEKLVNNYSGDEVNEETLTALKSAGMTDLSINRVENSLLKYNEKSNLLDDDNDEEIDE